MKIKVRAKETKTFNNFGDGGITYHKGIIYNAEKYSGSCIIGASFFVKHNEGGELGFPPHVFYEHFEIVK